MYVVVKSYWRYITEESYWSAALDAKTLCFLFFFFLFFIFLLIRNLYEINDQVKTRSLFHICILYIYYYEGGRETWCISD